MQGSLFHGCLVELLLLTYCVLCMHGSTRPSTGSSSTSRRPDTSSSTTSSVERATLQSQVKDLRRQNNRLRKKLEEAKSARPAKVTKADPHPHLRQAMQEMPEKLRKQKLGREKAEQALEVRLTIVTPAIR